MPVASIIISDLPNLKGALQGCDSMIYITLSGMWPFLDNVWQRISTNLNIPDWRSHRHGCLVVNKTKLTYQHRNCVFLSSSRWFLLNGRKPLLYPKAL